MRISTLFLWFYLYSILGWIYESIYCSVRTKTWDNRGMLIGPYCPIYGVGAVLDVLVCSGLPDAGKVFFVCMAGSAVLEYTTSYTTERLFHAVWWDYSAMPMNLHGRICLPYSIGFGVAGLIVLYGIQPFMERLTGPGSVNLQEFLSLLFMAIFSADCALTADSLAAISAKLEAASDAIDAQIAERYEAFLENTREGLDTLKEHISLEEFRERRAAEEFKKTVASMNWAQARAARSSVSFRRASYSGMSQHIRNALKPAKHAHFFKKKN